MSKKILIVGGCGFIGHNLALELKKVGHEPYVIDSLAINNIYSIEDTEFENKELYTSILKKRIQLLKDNKIFLKVMDARDYHATSSCYAEFNPDIIIHLAAVSHANKSNKDPKSTFDHSLRTLEKEKKSTLFICRQVWFMGNLIIKKFPKIIFVNQLEFMGL